MSDKISSAETTVYMLLSIEARLNAQAKILIEIADILTQKDPGTIQKEYTRDAIMESKKVLERMLTDTDVLNTIKKML